MLTMQNYHNQLHNSFNCASPWVDNRNHHCIVTAAYHCHSFPLAALNICSHKIWQQFHGSVIAIPLPAGTTPLMKGIHHISTTLIHYYLCFTFHNTAYMPMPFWAGRKHVHHCKFVLKPLTLWWSPAQVNHSPQQRLALLDHATYVP